jgi:hypothetical protein
LYSPRPEKPTEIVKEKERQIQVWKNKYYSAKAFAAAQAKQIDELNDKVRELKLQTDLKETAAVKSLEKVLINKNTAIRQLENQLEAKAAELTSLSSPSLTLQTSKGLRPSRLGGIGQVTHTPLMIAELVKENKDLKEKLSRSSNQLSQDVLAQLDCQFTELEEMQTKLLAENEALREDKAHVQLRLQKDFEDKIRTLNADLARTKAELRQINSIARTLSSGGELRLELLLGRHPEASPNSDLTLWEKTTGDLAEVKQEVRVLGQTLSDHYASQCSVRGCQTQ